MDSVNKRTAYFPKFFSTGEFKVNSDSLTSKQNIILWSVLLLSVAVRVFVIPYNMMDMGDSATRVWNALWWAQKPFFVLPESGHPLWFYLMGPVLMITKEFFYTSAFVMIMLMTLAGYYIFRTTLLFAGFRAGMLAFVIFTLNPVIFRLNFEPYSQQPYLTAICIMLFFFVRALGSDETISKKYFTIAGVFAFLALATRPEAIFVLLPFCLIAFLSRKNGCCNYIFLALLFQVIWIVLSLIIYGTPFKTIQGADQYTENVNIQGLSLGLRGKGFFLPYYFLVLGLTIFVFWYFIKGLLYSYKSYPKIFLFALLTPILAPALINGAAGAKSTIYHTTHYIYLMFYVSPVFAAIGLNNQLEKFRASVLRFAFASIVILTCIPLSYVKDLVPQKFNKMFPKIIEFEATTEDPDESRKLIAFIDDNIKMHPAMIFDAEGSESSIFYIPYRTKLPAPPAENSLVMVSGYNVPKDKIGLTAVIKDFMGKNGSGIIMTKRSGTVMSEVISDMAKVNGSIVKAQETEKWVIYLYK